MPKIIYLICTVVVFLAAFHLLNASIESSIELCLFDPTCVRDTDPTQNVSSPSVKNRNTPVLENITVSVAAVVCGDQFEKSEAGIMMKSVVISALLHNVSKLNIFLFLVYQEDALFFASKLKEYGYPFRDLDVHLHVRLISDLPKQNMHYTIFPKALQCISIRSFLPNLLAGVDAVLYLNVDVIITGSLVDIWSYLGKMTGEQMIGAAQYKEKSNPNWPNDYNKMFAAIPHPHPMGINSHILLMNLTKMREYDWQAKLLQLHKDYSKLHNLNDQRLLNILFHYDEGILLTLPCQFNFKYTHCDYGLYCDGAIEDSKGIQIVNGAAGQFKMKQSFRQIFLGYGMYNMESGLGTVKKDLMLPIRNVYHSSSPFKSIVGLPGNQTYSQCYGVVNDLLFKSYFVS